MVVFLKLRTLKYGLLFYSRSLEWSWFSAWFWCAIPWGGVRMTYGYITAWIVNHYNTENARGHAGYCLICARVNFWCVYASAFYFISHHHGIFCSCTKKISCGTPVSEWHYNNTCSCLQIVWINTCPIIFFIPNAATGVPNVFSGAYLPQVR